MKPRLVLYILLALAGAGCLYSGLKFHRHILEDGAGRHESLTVGLAASPLYTRQQEPILAGGSREPPTESEDLKTTYTVSITSSWHPISASALLAMVGLVLLLAAGRVRKSAA